MPTEKGGTVSSGARKHAEKRKARIAQDAATAETNAHLAADVGLIRTDQMAGYVRGWLNRGFYK